MKRKSVRTGMSFVELVISLVILANLCLMAIPTTENDLRRLREIETRQSLRDLRRAIDRYQEMRLRDSEGQDPREAYPTDLEELVRKRFLRSIPIDSLTRKSDWLILSTTDEPADALALASDGKNVFDVRTRAKGTTLEGIPYGEL